MFFQLGKDHSRRQTFHDTSPDKRRDDFVKKRGTNNSLQESIFFQSQLSCVRRDYKVRKSILPVEIEFVLSSAATLAIVSPFLANLGPPSHRDFSSSSQQII